MIQFFHVTYAYGQAEVLSDVTLSIESELAVIAGPAGSGKSVLLRLLCGLEKPTSGWISVDGFPLDGAPSSLLSAHRRRLAVLPQRARLVPSRDAAGNVALALEVGGAPARRARQEACAFLERLSLGYLAERSIETLSESEIRWVAVARALVRSEASVLVLDDPMAGLDASSQHLLAEVLSERAARGRTIVVASQQPGIAGLAGHRVAMLAQGRIAWDSAEPIRQFS
jgi:ABC-type multidrug transport system ATPase subunit